MNNNKSTGKSEKEIIFPSHKLGIEEEFLPGTGTFNEDHEIRSAVFGEAEVDRSSYRAKVYSFAKGGVHPKRHDTVIGLVENVTHPSVRIKVAYINYKPAQPSYSAVMHISDASRDFIKNIDDFYSAGDVIRATVIDAKSIPIQLECKKSNNGVIVTNCVRCGEYAEKIKRDSLQCVSCGWKQSRSTAIDYGKVSLNTKL